MCVRFFLFAWQCAPFHGKGRHFPSWSSIIVGCNRIFEGMNHQLLGCVLEKMSLMPLGSDFSIGVLCQMIERRPVLGRLGNCAARQVQINSNSICFNGWWFRISHWTSSGGRLVSLCSLQLLRASMHVLEPARRAAALLWWGWSQWPAEVREGTGGCGWQGSSSATGAAFLLCRGGDQLKRPLGLMLCLGENVLWWPFAGCPRGGLWCREMSNTGILCCSHSSCSERCVSTRYSLQNKNLHFGHMFGNFIVLHPDVTSDGQNSEWPCLLKSRYWLLPLLFFALENLGWSFY